MGLEWLVTLVDVLQTVCQQGKSCWRLSNYGFQLFDVLHCEWRNVVILTYTYCMFWLFNTLTGETSSHLPFVHNVSVVLHKVSAEGAKCTKLPKWHFLGHKHCALQKTNKVTQ